MEDLYLQKTINNQVEVTGINALNGKPNNILIKPAEPNTGLVLIVNGIKTKASLENAHRVRCGFLNLGRTIAIGKGRGRAQIVEHALSAVYSLGVDNLEIQLSDNTFPTTNNCGKEYFNAILDAGIKTLEGYNKKLWRYNGRIHRPVPKKNGHKGSLIVGPGRGLIIEQSVASSYPAIGSQTSILHVTPENYRDQVMEARPPLRFYFNFPPKLIKGLLNGTRKHGVHGMTDRNYSWIFKHESKYMNSKDFGVRYGGKEYTRHKVLDMLGTLALTGGQLIDTHLMLRGTNHQSEIYNVKEAFKRNFIVEYHPKQKQILTQKIKA